MRYTKHTEVSKADEVDCIEQGMREALPDGEKAMAIWQEWDGSHEEKTELWFRFASYERSAMKERREVRRRK